MSLIKHHENLVLIASIGGSLSSSHSSIEDMVLKAIIFIIFDISLSLFALSRLDFSLWLWHMLCKLHPFFTRSFFFGFLYRRLGILRLLTQLLGAIHVIELIKCLDVLCELLNSLLLLPRFFPFLTAYVWS